MKVSKLTHATIEIRNEYHKDKNVFHFLLCSDVHWDNPHCDRKRWYADLQKAREIGAKVLCFGDFFCMMQGKYDPRRSKSGIRPEHNQHNYLDLVINDAAYQHEEYADLFAMISLGNHETSITRNCETDPMERFLERLNMSAGTSIQKGKYQGFVVFKFHQNGGRVRNVVLFYHHGKFGGIVTKGVLGVNRYGVIVPDADIVVSGHTHDRWFVEQSRFRLKQNGDVKVEPQWHIKTGTYKEEFEQMEGWATERIVAPKSLGGIWLTIDLSGRPAEAKTRVSTDI